MTSNLAVYGKIVGKSALKWMTMFILGILVCFLGSFVAILAIHFSDTPGLSAAGHTGIFGAIMGLFYLFASHFWPTTLIVSSLIIFPVLYFATANKAVIQYAIYQVASKKISRFVSDKIEKYAENLEQREGSKFNNISNYANLKLQLVNESKTDAEGSKWQKRIIGYILGKIDIDTSEISSDMRLSKLLGRKANTFMDDFAQPSGKFTYMVFGGHFVLMLLAVIF